MTIVFCTHEQERDHHKYNIQNDYKCTCVLNMDAAGSSPVEVSMGVAAASEATTLVDPTDAVR
jgi:hypothetical protein